MAGETTSGGRRRLLLVLALTMAVALPAAVVGVAVVGEGGERPARKAVPPLRTPRDLARAVTVRGVVAHMRALQRIAAANGGNRAAGTAGDRASAGYVARRLRSAGWTVRLQPLRFPYFETRSPPRLTADGLRVDAVALRFSGSGTAIAQGQRVGSGCRREEYAALTRGAIAIANRGDCFLRRLVRTAQAAGAAGVVTYDRERAGSPLAGTLIAPGARIPAVAVGQPAGIRLARSQPRLRLSVDAVSERRATSNVIAELGHGSRVAMAGGHLDSVPEGPGVNDNGSGVGTLLEVAEQIAASPTLPRRRLRLGFWAAEELGLYGSRRHVRGLDRGERRSIAGYLNLDMVGSPNGGRFVYGGREGAARRALAAAQRFLRARGIRSARVAARGSSDHAPFESAGIPILGIYSGGPEEKNRKQRSAWGGDAGEPFDSCYHRGCDRLARIDRRSLSQLGDGAAVAVFSLAF